MTGALQLCLTATWTQLAQRLPVAAVSTGRQVNSCSSPKNV